MSRQMKDPGLPWMNPVTMPYGYPGHCISDLSFGSRCDSQCGLRANDFTRVNQKSIWHMRGQPRIAGACFQEQGTRWAQGNALSNDSAAISTQDVPTDWSSAETPGDGTGNVSSRRQTRPSISDLSDATVSSRTDVSSSRSISEDLQGLTLADHPSLQLIASPGSSPRSQHWDPILGDVQRDHDTLVVRTILQELVDQYLTIQRISLDPTCVFPGRTSEHETLDPRKYSVDDLHSNAVG